MPETVVAFWKKDKLCFFILNSLLIKMTSPIIKNDSGTKLSGKTFVQQSISCFSVISFFNSSLNKNLLVISIVVPMPHFAICVWNRKKEGKDWNLILLSNKLYLKN